MIRKWIHRRHQRSQPDELNQQLLPLTVLDSYSEELTGITRFQKIVYFVQQESSSGYTPYYYEPKFGPVSEELNNDIQRLVSGELITTRTEERAFGNTATAYDITQMGKRAVNNMDEIAFPVPRDEVLRVVNKHRDKTSHEMYEYIADEYPKTFRNADTGYV